MIAGWAALLTALIYLCVLFAVAHYGDMNARAFKGARSRPFIYAMTLGVYCTSWTFFGSVGYASEKGLEFLPIYIGPMLVSGARLPLHPAHRAPVEVTEHHLGGGFRGVALRQVAGRGGRGGADRRRRRGAVYRAAAEGDRLARSPPCWCRSTRNSWSSFRQAPARWP